MFCSQCGSEIQEGVKFCPNCGKAILDNDDVASCNQASHTVSGTDMDVYENMLEEKAKKEKKGNIIAFSVVGILCLILVINNNGYREYGEILIMCAITSFVVLAVYGVIAGCMGFYGAEKYFKKYQQMKQEIGKTEAIKMIEQQFDPTKGFSLMRGGIHATGGCLSSIVGFAITIIAVILVLALC